MRRYRCACGETVDYRRGVAEYHDARGRFVSRATVHADDFAAWERELLASCRYTVEATEPREAAKE